ncbi:MAG TPA: SPASM domain-containing protein, partial [Blastocatellia bacterium]|nr:SPASM domain-containing protein [Blastocatellia bacterium]
ADTLPQIEATYTQAHRDAGLSMDGLIDFLHNEFLFSVGTVANVDLPEGHPLAIPMEEASHEITSSVGTLTAAMARGELPKMERSFLFPIIQFIRKSGTRFTCSVGHDGFDITTEGDIYPCQVYIGQDDFLMGTVDDFDYDNPSPRLKRALDRMMYADKETNPICRECWAKAFCVSCPGSHIFASNDYHVPESFCNGMRKWVENILSLLYEIKKDPAMWANFMDGLKILAKEVDKQKPGGFAPLPFKPSVPLPPRAQQPDTKLYQLQGLSRS